jgi:transitional endoplasmic reticulum ATPase
VSTERAHALTAERLPSTESGDGRAFVDPAALDRAGIEAGSVVELRTHRGRRLLARVAPRSEDAGRGVVRLDRYQMRFLKPDLHEAIVLSPVEVAEARRVVLEPLAPMPEDLNALEREIARRTSESAQLVCGGMLVPLRLSSFSKPIPFRVISSDPERAVVGAGTRVVVRTSALGPGTTASLVNFDDVGGLRPEIAQIRELVEFPLRYPQVYDDLGIEPPRGILLHGPPGVGKTYLARAIANEIGAHFVYVNGPEVVSSVHGGTEANLRRVFEEAMEHSPAVVLIDELDSIAPDRRESGSQADVRMGTQLLSLLDGLISMEDVIVIGTTNRAEALDPALRRPGRLDREIFIGPPDADGRREILDVHTRGVPLSEKAIAFLPDVARMTHGYVGADLMELVRQAALNALRRAAGPGFTGSAEVAEGKGNVVVQKKDLLLAMQQTHPSALRESLLVVPEVSWSDIGGLADVVDTVREAVEMPLLHPEAFARLRVRPNAGILLYGPPGTGKTMLAQAAARECGANFIAIDGPEVFNKWLGASEEAIRHVFRISRQVAPTVLFFDQLDAIAPRRSGDSVNATTARVVSQLLAELDGIEVASRVVVLGATNRRDLLDPALLRPGRLGRGIYVGLPDEQARGEIARVLIKGVPTERDVDVDREVERLAGMTDGFSGADIAELFERAKLLALRGSGYSDEVRIGARHLTDALDRLRRERTRSSPVEV